MYSVVQFAENLIRFVEVAILFGLNYSYRSPWDQRCNFRDFAPTYIITWGHYSSPPKDLCTAERFWEMATTTSGILLLQLTWWLICVQQKDKTTATTFLGCRCNCLLLRSPQIRGRSHAGANRSSKTRSAINGLETAVWFIVHAHNWCIW